MNIDPAFRQRILTSLRWLVKDAQWRFDQCKDAGGLGGGGYSPELKEAILVLEQLEQAESSTLFFKGIPLVYEKGFPDV